MGLGGSRDLLEWATDGVGRRVISYHTTLSISRRVKTGEGPKLQDSRELVLVDKSLYNFFFNKIPRIIYPPFTLIKQMVSHHFPNVLLSLFNED